LAPARLKYASGLFNMMRNLGGAVGIALCGAVLNDQTNLHFLNIASNLTPANGAMDNLMAGLTARLTAVLGSAPAGHLAALEQLQNIAYREATTMAYADAFRTIMLAFLITTPLVLLLRKVAPPKASAAEGH
jgi:MFS transporter, DHA2 family, multidrug resistance protein